MPNHPGLLAELRAEAREQFHGTEGVSMEGERLKELIASINFDPPALLTEENRREYEKSKTQWTLIEEGQGAENGRVIYCYAQEQLDDELANCFRTGGVIVELFIDRQQLTDQERIDFLAEASQAHEEHRAGG